MNGHLNQQVEFVALMGTVLSIFYFAFSGFVRGHSLAFVSLFPDKP